MQNMASTGVSPETVPLLHPPIAPAMPIPYTIIAIGMKKSGAFLSCRFLRIQNAITNPNTPAPNNPEFKNGGVGL